MQVDSQTVNTICPPRQSTIFDPQGSTKNAKQQNGSIQQPTTASLLGIPWELREQILRDLLVCDEPLKAIPPPPKSELSLLDDFYSRRRERRMRDETRETPPKLSHKAPPKTTFKLHLAILAVNRQLKQEASAIFYGENTMTFRVTGQKESWRIRGSPARLTIYHHEVGKDVNLSGDGKDFEPGLLKFQNLHFHILLEKEGARHRVAWVLRYLVAELNNVPGKPICRNVAIVYEDRQLDDTGYCESCYFRPSRCGCQEALAVREEAREIPRKVLEPFNYLDNANNLLFNVKQTVDRSCLGYGEDAFDFHDMPTYSLEPFLPTELIQSIKGRPSKTNVYPMYNHLLKYLKTLPDGVGLKQLVDELAFAHPLDPTAPEPEVEVDVYFDIDEDDHDDMGHGVSDCTPLSLRGRCPSWLLFDMQIVKRAMLRGDVLAFKKLRSDILQRVNIVTKLLQERWFEEDDGTISETVAPPLCRSILP